ncbi:MAG: hypothetical protein HDS10_05970 [Bacteroides sp.]|nr:hypothetical protein [Bacteroides sp.]
MKINDKIFKRNNFKNVLSIVKRFVEDLFPYNQGIMLTGSVLTEFYNATSDIDVIVLSNLYRKVYIESYEFEGKKLQAIVLPTNELDELLLKDAVIGGGIYLHQLHNGYIMRDPIGILNNVKKRAACIYNQGPVPLTDFQLDQLRGRITSRLEDIKGSNKRIELLFSMIDVMPKILEVLFRSYPTWNFQGKAAAREILKIKPNFERKIIGVFEDLMKDDKSSSIEFLSNFLESIGGENHFYSTREIVDRIEGERLIIFMGDKGSPLLRAMLPKVLDCFFKRISTLMDKISIIPYFIQFNETLPSGLYVICMGRKDCINRELLPRIEMFQSQLMYSPFSEIVKTIDYPYSINPLTGHWGNDKEIMEILTRVYNLSKMDDKVEWCSTFMSSIDWFEYLKIEKSTSEILFKVLEDTNIRNHCIYEIKGSRSLESARKIDLKNMFEVDIKTINIVFQDQVINKTVVQNLLTHYSPLSLKVYIENIMYSKLVDNEWMRKVSFIQSFMETIANMFNLSIEERTLIINIMKKANHEEN